MSGDIGVIGGADGPTVIVVSGSIAGPILWAFFGALALMAILYFSFSGARWLLVLLTTAAMLALIWLLAKIVRHPLGQWSLACIIGGGVGNLIDRVCLGYVVDMLETMFMSFPVFNVADVFVVCGTVGALVYYFLFYGRRDEKNWGKGNDGTDPAADK